MSTFFTHFTAERCEPKLKVGIFIAEVPSSSSMSSISCWASPEQHQVYSLCDGSHMTLHGSPPAATGAAMAGDAWVPPISPSRLRLWKAPKKASSLAAAGFLTGVVCCKGSVTRTVKIIGILTSKVLSFVKYDTNLHKCLIFGFPHPWQTVLAPELSLSNRTFCVLLGQQRLLSFPVENTQHRKHEAQHMLKQLIHLRYTFILRPEHRLSKHQVFPGLISCMSWLHLKFHSKTRWCQPSKNAADSHKL